LKISSYNEDFELVWPTIARADEWLHVKIK